MYRIDNIPLLHSTSKKSFLYEIEHTYFATRSDWHYTTFPYNENVLHCLVSSGHFYILDAILHPVAKIQECSNFLFEDDKEKISKYYQISV